MTGRGQVSVPARGRAEHELDAPGVAGGDCAANVPFARGDLGATGGADRVRAV